MGKNENYTRHIESCPSGLIVPILAGSDWNPAALAALYMIGICYAFVGISIVTEIFLGAVVTITSQTKRVYLDKSQRTKDLDRASTPLYQGPEFVEVRVWNDTVANLTMTALGTSAPEILLACIEIVGHNFESGEIGPGTIMGAAAFNLLIVTAVCVMSVPRGESRRIRLFQVYLVCSVFSVFAYVWVWIVLTVVSPNVVELWEALVTLLMFPILVFTAFAGDKGWYGFLPRIKKRRQVEVEREEDEAALIEKRFFKDGKVNRESLIAFVRELRKYPGVSDEDAAILAASKVMDSRPQTNAYYRIGAVRNMTGGRKLRPQLSTKLQKVYDAIKQQSDPRASADSEPSSNFSQESRAIVEFHAASCAVRHNVEMLFVIVKRRGNPEPAFDVRVESHEGSAKEGEHYVRVDTLLKFESGDTEKKVMVRIINGSNWKPEEEFFLKLSLIGPTQNDFVQLGRILVMEITVLDVIKPGVIAFEKPGILIKESEETAVLDVRRKFGAEGKVSVKWRTIDDTAISGRDFVGGGGELTFRHTEVLRAIEIPITVDLSSKAEKRFEVELFSPTNGAALGIMPRTWVTIMSDEAFAAIADKVVAMTSVKVDSTSVVHKTWVSQMKDAMNVNGGNLEGVGVTDYILHFISFNWKVLFSFIPPPHFWGGWLCFVISLVFIGLVTAMICDMAYFFGCVVGLGDTTTAITLIALGTSLPDTFASRAAAIRERHADASVGNITGSNSVNVFLGLGLPWLIATVYHKSQGTVFRVPSAATMGFSVLLFTTLAFSSLSLLTLRRYINVAGKAELGGPRPFKFISGAILITMWVCYIILSSFQEAGFIVIEF